ncbi:hypothetical protein EXE46_01640 [Halorubrum sp. GN11_10-6_MGM]|uniref:hypothetical protein n=2 Tax=unclassified Halorubrum TaxID=2642239 RepID=UPI0010F9DBB9|nr:hypothetical protein [Halorubrum sp. GN11_10-6_MGM]TKX75827.1 hypothetical protein EXE46_01640 [Halorubrum sp. GN11_10-6_MGM]
MYRQNPVKIGVGIGVFGALFLLLTTILLFVVPQELMSSTASNVYIDTWSQPIMTVGGFVFSVGIPLACAVIAYYLTRGEHTPGSVVIGFLIGGIVFIIGNAILGVTVTNLFVSGAGVERSLLGHMQNSLPHGGRLFVGGLLGIAGALIVEEYF